MVMEQRSEEKIGSILPAFVPKVLPLYLISLFVFYFDFYISYLGLFFILYAGGMLSLKMLRNSGEPYLNIICLTLGVLGVLLMLGVKMPALYYPVLLNALVFYAFVTSLGRDSSLIEVLATRKEGRELSRNEASYCHRLTIIWTLFMLMLTGASLFTAIKGDLRLWSLFNGFISYVLILSLLIGELLFRAFYKGRLK